MFEIFKVEENIKTRISDLAEIIATGWYASIVSELEDNKIHSPIEQLFYAQWHFGTLHQEIDLIPQYKIGDYKVDFYLNALAYFINGHLSNVLELATLKKINNKLPKVVVELDGHKWHEKTPEQVEKDKQRERYIVGQGYEVLRFSGREIVKDPEKCVQEAYDHVNKRQYEVIKKYSRQGAQKSA